jgi:hypothetical protein
MTLILNEIHTRDGFNSTFIVAAADRRLSNKNGSYGGTRKKLFPIPYLKGAISYFGLAVLIFPDKSELFISDWLTAFIRKNAQCDDLASFSSNLRDELSRIVPGRILKQRPSGFHICGYNINGIPDFWYFSNIGRMQGYQYTDLMVEYGAPSSHFLDRDAKQYGWNGSDMSSVSNNIRIYRNGDLRAHVVAWEILDAILENLAKFPDFKKPTTLQRYGEYVKFKFEIIAYFYKNWARKQIIGRPIDVLVMTKDGYSS